MSAERGVPLTYVEAGIFAFGIDGATTHIAFRRAEAAALVDVAEAAREHREAARFLARCGGDEARSDLYAAEERLWEALDRLDEARR